MEPTQPNAAPSRPPAPSHISRDLFFIGGAMKSGTTWLQILLHGHPDISCAGESHGISRLGKLLWEAIRAHNGLLRDKNSTLFSEMSAYQGLSTQDFHDLLRVAMYKLLTKQQKFDTSRLVGEKTPDNVLNLPLIWLLFPRARFIHVLRDGRDCAVSAWFHNQRLHPAWLRQTYPDFDAYVRHMAGNWSLCLKAGEEARALRPAQYHAVRYEDLTDNPTAALAGVLDFLGAASTPAVVEACLAAGEFSRLSGGRLRGQADNTSFFRSGSVGGWREHFTPALEQEFHDRAGTWLTQFGYS